MSVSVSTSRVREGRYIDVVFTGSVASSLQGLINVATLQQAIAEQGIELPGDLDIALILVVGFHFHTLAAYLSPITAKLKTTKARRAGANSFLVPPRRYQRMLMSEDLVR